MEPTPATLALKPVWCGLDVLLAESATLLRGQRVGLLTNASGVTHDLRPNVAALRAAGVNLVALFAPEHGFSAAADHGAHVNTERDPRTGLPIHSLYGDTRQPTAAMLADIDTLLFDLQDVGMRCYTYTATLALALEACAQNNKRIIVLDRPNATNGAITEGPILDPALQSFVGHGPLPLRFGMTIGELAHFYNRQLKLNAELEVIALRGYRRATWYDQTGLPWVPPSPNIPQLNTATIYPGTVLLEGTNLSVGRGTTQPFEIVGAPFLDGYALADAVNALGLTGVRVRPVAFTPSADCFAHELCFGVQIHVTDREEFRPAALALHLLAALRAQYRDAFAWRAQHFDRLMGRADVREKLDQALPVAEIMRAWSDGLTHFQSQRDACLLYE